MSRTRSSRASSAASAQRDVDDLARDVETLSLASSLGKQYRVSGSPSADNASTLGNSANHKDTASRSFGSGSNDEDETPTASSQNTFTPPVSSARRRHSATGQQEESASCAPRASRPPPPSGHPGAQSAPPNVEGGTAVFCSAITQNGRPCRKKVKGGAYCHWHRAKDSPSVAPRVERKANVFLKSTS